MKQSNPAYRSLKLPCVPRNKSRSDRVLHKRCFSNQKPNRSFKLKKGLKLNRKNLAKFMYDCRNANCGDFHNFQGSSCLDRIRVLSEERPMSVAQELLHQKYNYISLRVEEKVSQARRFKREGFQSLRRLLQKFGQAKKRSSMLPELEMKDRKCRSDKIDSSHELEIAQSFRIKQVISPKRISGMRRCLSPSITLKPVNVN